MGKHNNPNRDNSIGKEERLVKNSSLLCTINGCFSNRYGYSKYCLQHKNHLAKTGDINQEYITQLKTRLKPYINEILKYIEENSNDEVIKSTLENANHLLKYKSAINDTNIDSTFNYLFPNTSSVLTSKIVDKLHTFKGDNKLLVSVVLSVVLFQKENPNILNTGAALFFHIGKLVFSYTDYDTKISSKGKIYKKINTLSRHQYLSIGVRFYSRFNTLIASILVPSEPQKAQTYTNALPQVKKSYRELLIQEKQERIEYVLEQQKSNKMITNTMVKKEIESIQKHFDKLIQEEKNKENNG